MKPSDPRVSCQSQKAGSCNHSAGSPVLGACGRKSSYSLHILSSGDGQFLPLYNLWQALWSILTSDHRYLNPISLPAWPTPMATLLSRIQVIALIETFSNRFWQFKFKCNGNGKEVLEGWLDVKLTMAADSRYGHPQQHRSGVFASECVAVSF